MQTYLALLVVTLAEATIGVFVKLTGDTIPILALNFYRVFFAALFLLTTVPFVRQKFGRFPKNNLRDIGIIGALIAAQISFFNLAMTLAPIANVMIFWSAAPFFVFIFSTLFLGEQVKKEHLLIFLAAFVGIIIAKPLSGGHALGNMIALADGAIYAGLVTYIRYEGKTELNNDIFWFMATAAIILLPGLFIAGPGNILQTLSYPALNFSVPAIVWPAALGIVSTGLAYLFISRVLRKISANVYSLVDIIFSPIVAAFLGYLIFNEMPSANLIYGGVLLLASGFWITRHMSEIQGQPYKATPAAAGEEMPPATVASFLSRLRSLIRRK